jgi:hypothetical protein
MLNVTTPQFNQQAISAAVNATVESGLRPDRRFRVVSIATAAGVDRRPRRVK